MSQFARTEEVSIVTRVSWWKKFPGFSVLESTLGDCLGRVLKAELCKISRRFVLHSILIDLLLLNFCSFCSRLNRVKSLITPCRVSMISLRLPYAASRPWNTVAWPKIDPLQRSKRTHIKTEKKLAWLVFYGCLVLPELNKIQIIKDGYDEYRLDGQGKDCTQHQGNRMWLHLPRCTRTPRVTIAIRLYTFSSTTNKATSINEM